MSTFANTVESLLLKQPKPRPALRSSPVTAYRVGFVASVKQVGDSTRVFRFVASTESPDRYGDVIRAAGWDLTAFKRNPIFLWAHRSGDPPIGKVVAISVQDKSLVADVEFASADVYPFAETIRGLYAQKFLSAVSVGFRPTAVPQPIVDEQTGSFSGYEFSSQELLEISGVPIPANSDCLQSTFAELRTEASIRKFWGEDNPAWAFSVAGVTHAVPVSKSDDDDPPAADPIISDPGVPDDPADPEAGEPEDSYKAMTMEQLEAKSQRLLAVIQERRAAQATAEFEQILLSKN